jgi:hypothetical protein
MLVNKDSLSLLMKPLAYRVLPSLHLLVFLALSLFTVDPVMAEVYKWVDEDGKVQYGDRPGNDSAEEIKLKKSPDHDAGLSERRETQKKMLDIYKEERVEKQEQRVKSDEERQKRKIKCAAAKKKLQGIRNAGFLYEKTDDPLNPRILSTEERTRAEAQIKAAIKHWCQ